jgi:predicted deacylase
MSKKGSVILKFGKDNPPILIYAGIHGDEIASNIATVRLIESLKNKKINCLIHIIPFTILKAQLKTLVFGIKMVRNIILIEWLIFMELLSQDNKIS